MLILIMIMSDYNNINRATKTTTTNRNYKNGYVNNTDGKNRNNNNEDYKIMSDSMN